MAFLSSFPRILHWRNFGHDKVRLTQHYPFRVDANKNFGNGFNVQLRCQFNNANLLLDDIAEPVESLVDQILIHLGIFRQVISCHFVGFDLATNDRGDVG